MRVLDYGCGNGLTSVTMAKMGASSIIGIDISDVSVENAKKLAEKEQYNDITTFLEMDAEHMNFPDNSFDIAQENGVLHHLDLDKAYADLARVLKPSGKMICTEALGHNPLIQYYRRRTPHLRTEWEVEHILHKKDIELAKKYFKNVRILGFFHLAAIAAVPFRNSTAFNGILRALETVDGLLLKFPVVRWQAWQVVFELSNPNKGTSV
jgi:ubiquinone/menaquinone biosynthesis C-methylase UbiE